MTDDEQHAFATIKAWTWSGFYSQADIREMLPDILSDDGVNMDMLHAAIADAAAEKRTAERQWPDVTDCDRLDAVFYHLHEQGICALHNAGYTISDGYSDVSEACAQAPAGHYHGYCFYHGQDVERAVEGHGLMIAFGDLDNREAEGIAIGTAVVSALSAAGFDVTWTGSMEQRIDLPRIDWRRRGPPRPPRTEQRPAPPDTPPATPPARPWWKFWG